MGVGIKIRSSNNIHNFIQVSQDTAMLSTRLSHLWNGFRTILTTIRQIPVLLLEPSETIAGTDFGQIRGSGRFECRKGSEGGSATLVELRSLAVQSNNKLSGKLPEAMASLTRCKRLLSSNNSFVGKIPDAVGSMTSLQHIDLSTNSFSGKIPDAVAPMTSLQYIGLSVNRLSCKIPDAMAFTTSLELRCPRIANDSNHGLLAILNRFQIESRRLTPILKVKNCKAFTPCKP